MSEEWYREWCYCERDTARVVFPFPAFRNAVEHALNRLRDGEVSEITVFAPGRSSDGELNAVLTLDYTADRGVDACWRTAPAAHADEIADLLVGGAARFTFAELGLQRRDARLGSPARPTEAGHDLSVAIADRRAVDPAGCWIRTGRGRWSFGLLLAPLRSCC